MATSGSLNNKPAVIRRVTSSSDQNTVTFTSVTQGQMDTADPSALITTDSVISKIDVSLKGIAGCSPLGGKRDFSSIKTVKDYNRTGLGTPKILDMYGRVVVIDGTDIKVEKTSSGQPKFAVTNTTLDADNAPGNLSYAGNKGLVYYTKMTAGSSVTTLDVD